MSSSGDEPSFWDNPHNFFDSVGPGFPKPIFITIQEARKEAKAFSRDIFTSWATLNATLKRHESLIRRRWAKKSQEQRKRVLLNAWPNMPPVHRPDYKVLEREHRPKGQSGTQNRDAYLFPYINIEDLVQGKSLLHFLHSRGRNFPEAFANTDLDAAHLGIVSMAIDRAFLNNYTMLLHGQMTPDTYGQIIAWEDNDDAFDWMIQGQGIQPGEGLLILEIQKKVLYFLVTCCILILSDMPPESLVSENTPIQPDPGPVVTDPTAWPSLAALSMEAPYRVPASLDFERLKAVIAAKFSAAKDHLWALREDPGYFASFVTDYSGHRVETLLDVNGRKHPDHNTPRFWDFVLGKVVISAYESLFTWELLRKQVNLLMILKQTFAKEISPKSRLPTEYMDALLYFRFLLDYAISQPIRDLRMILPPSPPLRPFFVREPQDPNSTQMVARTKRKKASKLLYAIGILWDDHQRFLHGLSNIMDELEYTLHNDESQKALVSPLVAETISDLSVMVESFRQLKLYQPWAANLDFESTENRNDFKDSHEQALRPYTRFLEAIKGVPLSDLGVPSNGFFHYPVDKRKTRGNTEAMSKAEHRLDAFWNWIDEQVTQKDGELRGFGLSFFGDDERKLHRTPKWVEPIQEPERKEKEEPYIPLAQMDLNSEERTRYSAREEKVKAKTRGVARPPTAVAAEQVTAGPTPSAATIAVSKRALKTFSILFYTPSSQSENPGEVPWPDFLHAMASAGFSIEKLYGSVWQFTPKKLDVEASIQFHEPHPQGRIPFVVARRHGRRLYRAYGWTGETFVRNAADK